MPNTSLHFHSNTNQDLSVFIYEKHCLIVLTFLFFFFFLSHTHPQYARETFNFLPTHPLPPKSSMSGHFMIKCGYTELPLPPMIHFSTELVAESLEMRHGCLLGTYFFFFPIVSYWGSDTQQQPHVKQMQYVSYWLGKRLLDTQCRALVKAWARTPQWNIETPNLYLFYPTNQRLRCYCCCERKYQSKVYICFARRRGVRHYENVHFPQCLVLNWHKLPHILVAWAPREERS